MQDKENNVFKRNEMYWGEGFQRYLSSLNIAVIGIGGVGGFALEALARSGIQKFLVADFDTVSTSNINRQLIALNSTVGLKKTDVFYSRLKDINPEIDVKIHSTFVSKDAFPSMFEAKSDFIVDAIDTVKSKIELIEYAVKNDINIISSFGAGNRMDASKLYVADISEINPRDSFIKNILYKLKKYANIESGVTVIASSEKPYSREKISTVEKIEMPDGTYTEFKKFTPASTPVVPAVAGYLAANHILQFCYNKYFRENP